MDGWLRDASIAQMQPTKQNKTGEEEAATAPGGASWPQTV